MTEIEQIRLLVFDPMQFDSAIYVGDSVGTKVFKLPYSPVIGTPTVYVGGVETHLYQINSSLGLVTLDSSPGVGVECNVQYQFSTFTDAEYQGFLDLEDSDARLAAALALESIASQQALILKRIKTLDLDVDGPAVAKSLREHAKALRDSVTGDSCFDFVEQADTAAQVVEKYMKGVIAQWP